MATNSQIKNALIRHQILVQRLAGGQYDAMAPFIDDVINRAFIRFASVRYFNIDEAKLLEQELLPGFKNMNDIALRNLDDFAKYEAQFIARTLNVEFTDFEKVGKNLLNKRMQIGLDEGRNAASLSVTLDRFAKLKSREIVKLLRRAAIKRATQEETRIQLERLKNKIKSQAKTLANTTTNHAAAIGKDTVYKSNKQVIEMVEWVSVLDSSTTRYCREHDGQRYAVSEGPRPPAHFQCRSVVIPIMTTVIA